MEIDRVRRMIRSKAYNVIERVEQLEELTQDEIDHVDAAIKYLSKEWDDSKLEILQFRHRKD